MINIISTNLPNKASDHTFVSLVDNQNIFLNDNTQPVHIINGPIDFTKKKNIIYGIRITDDIIPHVNYYKEFVDFIIVTSHHAYLKVKNICKNVIHIDDVTQTPEIINPHTIQNRFYTFHNQENLDVKLLSNPIDVYTNVQGIQHFLPFNNSEIHLSSNFIEWTPNSVNEYQKYKKAIISYVDNDKGKLKSINRLCQCFYFNQEVITNYKGTINPKVKKHLEIKLLNDGFYQITNTRKIYDKFYTKEVIKNKLINYIKTQI